jgi:hypothetical protein
MNEEVAEWLSWSRDFDQLVPLIYVFGLCVAVWLVAGWFEARQDRYSREVFGMSARALKRQRRIELNEARMAVRLERWRREGLEMSEEVRRVQRERELRKSGR